MLSFTKPATPPNMFFVTEPLGTAARKIGWFSLGILIHAIGATLSSSQLVMRGEVALRCRELDQVRRIAARERDRGADVAAREQAGAIRSALAGGAIAGL